MQQTQENQVSLGQIIFTGVLFEAVRMIFSIGIVVTIIYWIIRKKQNLLRKAPDNKMEWGKRAAVHIGTK